jgi:2-desacetyl-2-hydroxyethyl bacteriochlorophyllide A dehydrogenase
MMARALVTLGDGCAMLEERAALRGGEDELLVTPQVVGLCGTDLELVDGLVDSGYVRYPLVLGHEWVGRVRETRSPRFVEGDVVVVEGIVPCWTCAQCVVGNTHLCLNYQELGFTKDGAAADEVVAPARLAHRLGPSVQLDDAALVEPAAVVYHGLSRMPLRPGLSCLVIGDGTIGLLSLLLLKLWSPARLVMWGRRAEQRLLAERSGADEFFDGPVDESFDLVVEAAGTPDAVLAALAGAKRGGSVLLLGLAPEGVTTPVATADVLNNDLLVRASFGYSAGSWAEVVRLVNAGRFHPGGIITHRFELEDHEQALTVLRHPRSGEARGKVLLNLSHKAP